MKTAVLVDEYVLTHKTVFGDRSFYSKPVESLSTDEKEGVKGFKTTDRVGGMSSE